MEDDDEFGSDGGFEDLPANTLAQLEQDAFRSTQCNLAPVSRRNNRDSGYYTFVEPARSFTFGGSDDPSTRGQPPLEYGIEEEEVVDLDDLPQEVQQQLSQWPAGRPQSKPKTNGHIDAIKQTSHLHAASNVHTDTDDVAELRRRLLQLETERHGLQDAVKEAQALVQAKTGEASLLRQRVDKTTREYEDRISLLRRTHADADARQKAELAALQRDREKMATDNQFLEHDLVIQAGRSRQLTRPQKVNGNASPATTPKKNRVLPYRDGFDDGEVIHISPSKSRPRSKPSTPKAAGKRKRDTAPQSPIRPLALQPVEVSPGTKAKAAAQAKEHSELTQRLKNEKSNSKFVTRLLEYRSKYATDQDRLADTLSKFAFPAQQQSDNSDQAIPKGLFSNIVLDALARRSADERPQGMAGVVCDIFISLWDQCLKQSYHEPIDVLVEVITFICHTQRLRFAQGLSSAVVPLAVATCDLIAIPLAVAARKGARSNDTVLLSSPAIDVFDVLILLSRIAQACALKPSTAQGFWQLLKFDFVLMMLMNAQPLPQIVLMLQLLSTSVLSESFGTITTSDDPRRTSRENDTIKRLSLLMFEKFTPKKRLKGRQTTAETPVAETSDEDRQKQLDADDDKRDMIMQIRFEVMSIFFRLCTTDHGTRLIANHRFAMARLVRFLHDHVSELYTFSDLTHDFCINAINTTMRIIHHVVTKSKTTMDIKERIRAESGGVHIWLLVLTRLAFTDGVVAEAGITSETSDMAHQLLDEYLSPDEGEQLLKLVATGTSGD